MPTHLLKKLLPNFDAKIWRRRLRTSTHFEGPLILKAIALYDGHMSYYVNSLKAANSNYAYPTLGSTFAIHAKLTRKSEAIQKETQARIFIF